MSLITLNLLGSVEIKWQEESPPRFRSPTAIALLCYLVAENRPLSRTLLTDLFWPHQAEEQGRAELRRVLHNLSTILPGCLEADRQTVQFLAADRCQVDLFLLQQLSVEGTLPALQEAADLCRGELIEGFSLDDAPEFETWLLAERERWRQRSYQVLTAVIQYHTEAGRYHEGLRYARRLVAMDPWREEAQRQLIALLSRTGQFSAALRQYELCRQALTQELGTTPATETTVLYERIKLAAAHLPSPPPSATLFVGREQERMEIGGWLRQTPCHLVTIIGPGGIGKTRLAQQVAADQAAAFLNGVCWVSLVDVPTADSLLTALAAALKLELKPQPLPAEQVKAALQARELLLLLDSFDDFNPAHANEVVDLVADWLTAVPTVKILVTSRQALGLQEERLYQLDGLSFPADNEAEETTLQKYTAMQLFVISAQRRQRQFSAQPHLAAIGQLCRLLDGLPLALELAAALVPSYTPAEIVQAVSQNPDLLQAPWRNALPRHRSLRVVFDQSWQQLTAVEQTAFARLSVFQGGFTADAGQSLGLPLATLEALQLKSLLQLTGERYDSHPVLRQYAAEALQASGQSAQARQHHAHYYAGLLQAYEDKFANQVLQVQAVLTPEHGNLRAAWQWALNRQEWSLLADMVTGLYRFYEVQHWHQEGSRLFLQAVSQLQTAVSTKSGLAYSPPPFLLGQLYTRTAALLLGLGQVEQALALAQQALPLLQEDKAAFATGLDVLGVTQIHNGRYEEAEAHLKQAIALWSQVRRPADAVRTYVNLGSVYARQGKYEASQNIMEQGLTLCQQVGDQRGMLNFQHNLGALYLMQGDMETAVGYLERCLPLCDQLGYQQIKLTALYNLGEIYLDKGEVARAAALCDAAIDLAQETGQSLQLARALKTRALTAIQVGETTLAWTHLRQGLEIAHAAQSPPTLLDVLEGVAVWQTAVGQQKQAVALLTFIYHHPQAEQQHRDKTARRLRELTGDVVEAYPSSNVSLETLVQDLLRFTPS